MRNFFLIILLAIVCFFSSCTETHFSIDSSKPFLTLKGHATAVECLAVSPDGKTIASGGGWQDGNIKLWSAETGEEKATIDSTDNFITSLDFSPDSKILVSTSDSRTVMGNSLVLRFQSTDSGRILNTLNGFYMQGRGKAFYSANGEFMAFVESGGASPLFPSLSLIRVWSTKSAIPIRTIKDDECKINNIAITNDGKTVIGTGSIEKAAEDRRYGRKVQYPVIRLWSVDDGKIIQTYSKQKSYGEIVAMSLSPDGKYLAVGFYNKEIDIHSAKTGGHIKTIQSGEHEGVIRDNWGFVQDRLSALAFSPNSSILASSEGEFLKFWNARSGKLLDTVDDKGGVTSLAWSPDGQFIAYGTSISQDELNMHPINFPIKLLKTDIGKLNIFEKVSEIAEPVSESIKTQQEWKQEVDNALFTLSAGDVTFPSKTLAFSPDGETLAASGGMSLWSMKTGEKVTELNIVNAGITEMAFARDGNSIVGCGWGDCNIYLWKIREKNPIKIFHSKYPFPDSKVSDGLGVISLDVSPDGKLLASGGREAYAKLWNFDTGEELLTFKVDIMHRTAGAEIVCVHFSPDGHTLAILGGNYENRIKLWSVPDGKLIRVFDKAEKPFDRIAFSADGSRILGWFMGNGIQIWTVDDGKFIKSINPPSDKAECQAFSPVGDIVATGNLNGTVDIWSLSSGKTIKSFTGNLDRVISLAFSPDGKLLASGAVDRKVRVFSLDPSRKPPNENRAQPTREPEQLTSGGKSFNGYDYKFVKDDSIMTIEDKAYWSREIAFSPDGQQISGGGDTTAINSYDVKTGRFIRTIPVKTRTLKLKYSPDGNIVANCGNDDFISLLSVKSGERIKDITSHSGKISDMAFSPDGKLLALGGEGNIEIRDINTDQSKIVFSDNSSGANRVTFSPSGDLLASVSGGTIYIWKAGTGDLINTIDEGSKFVESIAFSPDGVLLGSCSYGNSIELWSVETGKLIRKIDEANAGNFAFSPDGKLLASCSFDNALNLWSVETGEKVKSFSGHIKYVLSVAFSPDGKTLASSSTDGTIKLWSVY